MLDRAKPGVIAVNSSGRRFVNEANSYHDFVEAMLRSHATAPSIPSYLICDRSFIRDYGLGTHPSRHPRSDAISFRSGYLFCGDTIAKLAKEIGVGWRRAGRNNRHAITDLPKPAWIRNLAAGSSELNRFNGDPLNQRRTHVCAGSGPGPYFAVAVWPSDLAEQRRIAHRRQRPRADIRTHSRFRVYMPPETTPSSIFRGTYPGPGNHDRSRPWCSRWRAAMDMQGLWTDDRSQATLQWKIR